jgi:hypothetical protein
MTALPGCFGIMHASGTPMSRQGTPVPTTTPDKHRRHFPRRRLPTARLPERGLRDSEDHEPPICGHGISWQGSG